MPSPGPRGGRGGGRAMLQKGELKTLNMGTVKRLLSYLKAYRFKLFLVCLCIVISAFASVKSSLFIQTLIDDHITPLLVTDAADFSGLFREILKMCAVFLCGILSTLFYSRTMGIISQGTLKIVRDEMYDHMQTLPIKYFDTNSIGDIMSHYTNDTDALRQMLSQTLPQLVSSVISMITVTFSMLHLSVYLTVLAFGFAAFAMILVRTIVGKSGGFFVKQQKSIGKLNGYVEEMIN
ncbi:MAG: ABC transporter ATP-binding protein, partial [Clostridia bacterium]|nr:ABC transporter ATP-binding protein [Clostridia bacterium]